MPLVDVMVNSPADGQVVRLGEPGGLRVSLRSEGMATADEVNASVIKGAKVIFAPGKDIKKMLNNLEYQKL